VENSFVKPLVLVSIAIGVLLILLGVYYFITPANQLPAFIPGSDPNDIAKHYKHGIASILLGVGALIFAWFRTGNQSKTAVSEQEKR
jgi:uncharacterized membrane protein